MVTDNKARRFYRLVGTEMGTLPPHEWLKLGVICAVDETHVLPGMQWNGETREFVIPIWEECDDPRSQIAPAKPDVLSTLAAMLRVLRGAR